MVWKLLGGRGKIGDRNWGVDYDDKTPAKKLKPLLKQFLKHKGERVLLTGGGGSGRYICRLKDAEIVKAWGDCYRVQAHLKAIDKDLIMGCKEFAPFIDSWQISVWVDN